MKKTTFLALLLLSTQSIASTTSQSLEKDPDAELKLGAGVSFKVNAYRANNSVSVVPLAFYDNNVWYAEGAEAGFYSYKDNTHHARLGLSYDGRGFDNDDVKGNYKALNARKSSVLAHASHLYITPYGGIRAKVATDILRKHKGSTVSLAYLSRFKIGDTTLYPSFGAVWQSQGYNNYYYGITADESTRSGLQSYTADAGVSPFVSLTANHDLSDKISLFGNGRMEWLSSSQKDSPLIKNDTENTITLGAMYRFK